jgi:hypothetical protein
MATIQNSLIGITLFPLPSRTIEEIAARRGLCLSDEATQETLTSKTYCLAKADLLMWLSYAPTVTQGGQSYSFSDEQRLQFRNQANSLYKEYASEDNVTKPIYGYKGSRL